MSAQKRVLVAMSGGVDSSVAAYLLQQQGYTCEGATMRLYDASTGGRDPSAACGNIADIADARAVCERLGIPHRVFDLRARFKTCVIDRFVDVYRRGQTPNPCADCNRNLKFGALLDAALAEGCQYIATGHYARIGCIPASEQGAPPVRILSEAADAGKDQSYMLYSLTQSRLAHVLLPLGELNKERDVRRIAREQNFVNARKRDSQGICFVPDNDFAGFIERRQGSPLPEGDILASDGTIIGRHRGAIRFTIGQRRGLGVASERPLFVTAVDAQANTVTLGDGVELAACGLIAREWVWTMPREQMERRLDIATTGEADFHASARTRYHQTARGVRVRRAADGDDALLLIFDEPQRAIAPGQAVVVYDGGTVLGGGTVTRTLRAAPESRSDPISCSGAIPCR